MAETAQTPAAIKYERIDTYKEWQAKQKIPLVTGFFVEDLNKVPVEPWDLKGVPCSFVVLDGTGVKSLDVTGRARKRARGGAPIAAPTPHDSGHRLVREVDLHGLTVDEALARADRAINDALLADVSELRVIHGRSGGRIRAALHRRLRDMPSVRSFRIDSRNPGVTVVTL